MFEIEKDVPLTGSGGAVPKYPWKKMAVGDSFFIPKVKTGHVSSSRVHAQKLTGYQFVLRTVEGGVRAWRTK